MSSKNKKVRGLEEKIARIKAMGGKALIAKQPTSGKLTARERLELLFDSGTFQEMDLFVRHRCTNFGMQEVEIPADGVITGFGKVGGRTVFAFSQDFTSRAGTLGEMHAQKICKVMDLALKTGAPIVGFNDSGGAYIAMCSRHLGADFVLAWPTAEIAVMGAEGAANIIFRKDIQSASDPKAKREEKIQEYRELFSNPYVAASRGYVDAIISPRETRSRIIRALEVLKTKKESRPWKKHGNIPV